MTPTPPTTPPSAQTRTPPHLNGEESGDVEASQIDCSHDVPFYGTPGMVSETVLTPRSSPQLLRSHD